jgi:hypothetical protein
MDEEVGSARDGDVTALLRESYALLHQATLVTADERRKCAEAFTEWALSTHRSTPAGTGTPASGGHSRLEPTRSVEGLVPVLRRQNSLPRNVGLGRGVLPQQSSRRVRLRGRGNGDGSPLQERSAHGAQPPRALEQASESDSFISDTGAQSDHDTSSYESDSSAVSAGVRIPRRNDPGFTATRPCRAETVHQRRLPHAPALRTTSAVAAQRGYSTPDQRQVPSDRGRAYNAARELRPATLLEDFAAAGDSLGTTQAENARAAAAAVQAPAALAANPSIECLARRRQLPGLDVGSSALDESAAPATRTVSLGADWLLASFTGASSSSYVDKSPSRHLPR